LTILESYLAKNLPVILFVRTGDLLPYWQVDTPHAVVAAGIDVEQVALFDPGLAFAPALVSVGNLLLAWSHFDYSIAVLELP